MTKPHETPMFFGGLSMFEAPQPEAVRVACGKAMEQLRDLHQAWLTAASKAVESTWGLAVQLPKCADPSEAFGACKSWFDDRRDAAVVDAKTLSDLWLKVCHIDPAMTVPFRAAVTVPDRTAAE
jgi:hypothetical protein